MSHHMLMIYYLTIKTKNINGIKVKELRLIKKIYLRIKNEKLKIFTTQKYS